MNNAMVSVSAKIQRRVFETPEDGQELSSVVSKLVSTILDQKGSFDELTALNIHVNREALHKMNI